MTPTIEEVKKVAIECGAEIVYLYDEECVEALRFMEFELQAFVQHYIAAERERCCGIIFGQCDSDNVAQRTVDAIRNNTGE